MACNLKATERFANFGEFPVAQFDPGGPKDFLKPMGLGGAGDRDDVGPLRQQPSERHLGRCGIA